MLNQLIVPPVPEDCPSRLRVYLDFCHTDDVLGLLKEQLDGTLDLLISLEQGAEDRSYAPGKWSVRQVVGHLIDMERVFAYRAYCITRGLPADFPDVDPELCVDQGGYAHRPLVDLAGELHHVRSSTILLFSGLEGRNVDRAGTVDGESLPVRAVPFVLAGHEAHHLDVLRTRYLGQKS